MNQSIKAAVHVKRLRPDAILPEYKTAGAACVDLSACLDAPVVIAPGCQVKIGTGLAFALPEGYRALMFPRSGMAHNSHMRLSNCVAVIDCDYRGEWIISVRNSSEIPLIIEHGMRIAQASIEKYEQFAFVEVAELDDTERGAGGFGSTGA